MKRLGRRLRLVLGIAVLTSLGAFAAPAQAEPLAEFMQPLPLPVNATPVAPNAYHITMRQTTQEMHPDLGPVTNLWGYDDGAHGPLYPGPTLNVQSGQPVSVQWTNGLPSTHILPMDTSLTAGNLADPLTLTHFHGGVVSEASDGAPVTSPGFAVGATQTVSYPNSQPAASTWYHDHALGMTRLNVYAGLAGFYLSRDANDTGLEPNGLGVPGGAYEIPLAIQDRSFTPEGQLDYPTQPEPNGPWVPEAFGDNAVVNGAVAPFASVEPRLYRFRVLNGSNARFWNLQVQNTPPIWQIGTDQGLLTKPVRLNKILLAPGERMDIVVDFSRLAGKDLDVSNVPLPPSVVSPATPSIGEVMQFQVQRTVTNRGPTTIPATLPGKPVSLPTSGFAATRNVTLEEQLDGAGEPVRLVLNGKRFDEPIGPNDERPKAGTVEEWRFVNLSADTHPMHMHLTPFQVVDRYTFDVARYAEDADAAHEAGAPNPDPMDKKYKPKLVNKGVAPEELGWKDTVRVNPGQFTRIRVKFDLPPAVSAPQRYVYHCHILEHEENDMMRPYDVIP
jgi:spore coat protein A